MRRYVLLAALLVVVVACGDPDTDDRRGYTKAPLERPGLFVQGEEPSEMTELGQPIRPRPPEHPPEPPAVDED